MSNDALDLAFARHVRQIGLITAEQVTSALQTQAKSLQTGKPITVAEAFVTLGLLTPAQREALEKKVKDQQAGIHQLGPYKLMKKLGEGGMGAVYLALDPATQKHVAVKVLPRHLGANAEFVKRFSREADAATRLKHPNIIGAFAAGEDLGYHYYVMEYCEGKALDLVLSTEKQLDVSRALDIVLQAARGLKYAHDQGIIHRDIKPSNIIVEQDGTAKILDLGLSKSLDDSSVSFKTVTGAVLGTPHYISPEQAQGEKNVDGRTDIYSLGATLYHLLTGKVPFDGATALEILSKHVNTVLPNPQDLREDIPDPAVHILLRMMAKEPADRYRDCAELITDLDEVNSGRTPKTHVISAALTTVAAPRSRSMLKKRPATVRRMAAQANNKTMLIAGTGVAAAVLVIVAVVFSGGGSDPVPTPIPARNNPPPRNPEAPAKIAFDPATWEKSVAGLSPEAQLKAVVSRLKDVNPGYDGSERHESGHGRISKLELSHVALRDLAPLRALTTLSAIDLSGSGISDLSALKDLPVTSLSCAGMKSVDLKSVRAMKKLKILSLKSAAVRDLAPLGGMDLWQLDLRSTGLTDLSPLRQVKLLELFCDFDSKRDTEILKSMADLEKINELPVEEFWRKERGPDAPAVVGPEEQLRLVLAKLKHLNPDHDGRALPLIENGAVAELSLSALALSDLSPLQELKGLRRLDVSGYWDPAEKKEYKSALSDLRPLKGLRLESFRAHHTAVADLEPLRGMKLETLDLLSTNVRDLSPIRGMPLKKLEVSFTHVPDLSPLEGMPLAELRCNNTDVTDFSVLKSLSLQSLAADLTPQKHRALVAGMASLQWLNGIAPAEFLKSGDKPATPAVQPKPPPAAPPGPEAATWKNAVDLIALVDPQRDAVRGNWKKENGRIISEFGENGVLRLPYEPPAEYDFKIVFTRARGTCAIAQFLQRDGRGFFWEMAGWGNVNSGFSLVKGKGSRENPTNSNFVPRDGVKYACIIQVRRDRVTALLDDKKISEWLPAMGEITTDLNWCVDVPNLIGIGNCESLTTFEVIQVREVSGKGRIRTGAATPPDPAFLAAASRLPAAEQAKRVIEKLKELNPQFDPDQAKTRIENDRVVEFATSTQRLTDLWPVRAFPALRKLDLSDDKNPGQLIDLTCLKGLKLQELNLQNTRVSDLTPLQQMPLTVLDLEGTKVVSLAPLKSTKLISLVISNTPVSDLTPLKDLPLQRLECERIAADLAPLKSIRTLKTINDQPAAEFLKGSKEGWTAIFDGRSLDCIRRPAGWKVDKGVIVNEGETLNAAQTNQEFENGDLRIRFELKAAESCMFRVRQSENGAWGVMFDGAQCRTLEGKTHELLFSCRGPQVTVTLDGKPHPLYESKPVRAGCLQFNATGGTLRVLSIEYRAAP